MDTRSSEPHAHALTLANPRNLCYANAVLCMLRQARSLERPITGLGEINGLVMQVARSNRMVNIARDPAWTFVWSGWQRPTHDSMMQLNSCNTFARRLNARPCEGDGRRIRNSGRAIHLSSCKAADATALPDSRGCATVAYSRCFPCIHASSQNFDPAGQPFSAHRQGDQKDSPDLPASAKDKCLHLLRPCW